MSILQSALTVRTQRSSQRLNQVKLYDCERVTTHPYGKTTGCEKYPTKLKADSFINEQLHFYNRKGIFKTVEMTV